MNKNQRRKSRSSMNRYAVWKYLVIVLSLGFMALNALPNLYPSQESIQLSKQNAQIQMIDTPNLHQLLTEQGFQVQSIDNNDQASRILLVSSNQNIAATQFLKTKLSSQYQTQLIKENTAPQWLKTLGGQPIKLGLDLSGGVLFVLDVDVDEAFSERIQHVLQSVRAELREQKLRGIQAAIDESGNVIVNARSFSDIKALATEIERQFPSLMVQRVGDQLRLFYSEAEQQRFHQEIMQQTLTTMRGRIEELGITEAVVQRQGSDRIRIELPGSNNPEEARPIIGATASLDFYELQSHGGKLFESKTGEKVRVNPIPIFTGDHIKGAQSGRDEMGMPLVNLMLDGQGGDKMNQFSSKNIGKPMVTVFSEYYQNAQGETVKKSQVINIATIQSALGSRFSITNLSSPQKAKELALLLRAGSLIAPVTITKERTINATLGEKNIDNGIAALMLGLGLTLAFMALWYRRLGLIANCALFLNLVCLLGLMSLLPGAVLTLPGIAGLVLTVGMAVDTNVLIFERIKEERKRGRSVAMAVDKGYKNAFATILDANITTLLTALILYSIGYGPVKGFAITLGLGILTSMFTGVFISRALTNLLYARFDSRFEKQGATL